MFELQVPGLLTELERDVFWTSHPAGFPSFLGRFLLVKAGWYFNEVDQEWKEVWMYTDGEEYLLDSDVNLIFSFQAGDGRTSQVQFETQSGSAYFSPAPPNN
jgi:hypothetical protein